MTRELYLCDFATWAQDAIMSIISRLGWDIKVYEGEDLLDRDIILVVTFPAEDYRMFQVLESFIHDF